MKKLIFENYINTIKKSVGAKMFQNLYCKDGGKVVDALKGGELSCAYFVSTILKMFGMIGKVHATVKYTVKDLLKFGWIEVEIDEIKEGDVILWDKVKYEDGSEHAHIGFYVGDGEAISNSTLKKVPVVHEFTYDGERVVERVLRYNSL